MLPGAERSSSSASFFRFGSPLANAALSNPPSFPGGSFALGAGYLSLRDTTMHAMHGPVFSFAALSFFSTAASRSGSVGSAAGRAVASVQAANKQAPTIRMTGSSAEGYFRCNQFAKGRPDSG